MRDSLLGIGGNGFQKRFILTQNPSRGASVVEIRIVIQRAVQPFWPFTNVKRQIELSRPGLEIKRVERDRAKLDRFRAQITELEQHLKQRGMTRVTVQRQLLNQLLRGNILIRQSPQHGRAGSGQ